MKYFLFFCFLSHFLFATEFSWESETKKGISMMMTLSETHIEPNTSLELAIVAKGLSPHEKMDSDPLKKRLLKLQGWHLTRWQVENQSITATLDPWKEGNYALFLENVDILQGESSLSFFFPPVELQVLKIEDPINTPLPQPPLSLKIEPRLGLGAKQLVTQLEKEDPNENKQKFINHLFPWKRVIVFLLVLLLGWMGFHYRNSLISWYQRKKTPQLSPKEEALFLLEQLKQRGLPPKVDIERFYVDLTDILRVFLEKAYSIRAPERTTEEFLQEMTSFSQFSLDSRQIMQSFLQEADLVKFAKGITSPEMSQNSLQKVWSLIDSTMK